MRYVACLCVILMTSLLPACAVSRHASLMNRGDSLATKLEKERDRVLKLSDARERSVRIEHLTGLRTTLSAANIGLGAVPIAIPAESRSVAYDVIEEVYDTISWNIPLAPGDPGLRAMPSQWQNNQLRLN